MRLRIIEQSNVYTVRKCVVQYQYNQPYDTWEEVEQFTTLQDAEQFAAELIKKERPPKVVREYDTDNTGVSK
jgi:hypothetical protein